MEKFVFADKPALIELNEKHFKTEIEKVADSVLDGFEDGLDIYTKLDYFEKILKSAKNKIRQSAVDAFELYGEKMVLMNNKKVHIVQSGRYNYTSSKEYTDLKERIKSLEAKMKTAYQMKLDNPENLYITETGEVIQPAEYKSNSKSLKIS